ncbi:unnamed protein product [Callosobruchus maculatus]|uniref:NtA domain-containing protein n=1 Tax=Callosobruchus maculatus TaxID=64391 RepID=A0A653DTL5_CALMS|nr:unnamed protein product [Callosobruchus maculatus]
MLLERRYSPRCIRHLLVALTIFWWLSALARLEEITDFISINTLPDGEVETRIYYKGVVAKETTTAKNKSLKFRQLSRGKRVLQLIYSDNKLVDCEFFRKGVNSTNPFLHNFMKDMRAIVAPDSTIPAALLSLDGVNTLPKNYAWVNWSRLRSPKETPPLCSWYQVPNGVEKVTLPTSTPDWEASPGQTGAVGNTTWHALFG